MSDHRVVGKVGRVTGEIAPGHLGEVTIPIRGSSEAFLARCDGNQTVAVGARVLVLEYLPPRTVIISPEV
ncbi:MAG TPA: hypothetical protein VFE36_14740 [Candidatus Baltobacteraceae bacterium]|jgi:hypothetical protein|nr:hypothetical protein [Candidatus Baltobacteraceae bacterium]